MATRQLKKVMQRNIAFTLTIPFLILAGIILLFYHNSLKSTVLRENQKALEILSYIITNDLQQAENRISTLASLLNKHIIPEKNLEHVLEEVVLKQKNLNEIRLLDRNDYVKKIYPINSELIGIDMSGVRHVQEAKRVNKPSWSKSYLSLYTGKPISSIAVPFKHGTIIASFDFFTLNKVVKQYSDDKNTLVAILDQGGVFLSHSDKNRISQRIWEPISNPLRKLILESGLTNNAVLTKDNWLVSGKLVSSTGWLVALYQNRSIITKPLVRLSLILGGVSLLFIILGIYVSLRATSNFFNYFNRLTGNFHSVATGKYYQDVNIEGFQELQEVENDFFLMTQQIKAREDEVNTLNQKLEKELNESKIAIQNRIMAETELQKSHETFITVLDGIDATIYVADLDTFEILYVNKKFEELFGLELKGKVCWDVLKGRKSHCPTCIKDTLFKDKHHYKEGFIWQEQNPVSKKWVINHDRIIRWVDGRDVKIQIASDITKLKEMEDKLHQAQKLESIGNLAGGIAHEFNNILSIIIGNNELIIDNLAEGSSAEENTTEISVACLRAREIVKQLLTFSRQGDVDKTLIDLKQPVVESIQLMRATIPSTVGIVKNICKEECPIMGNSTQINQVMINLLKNATEAVGDVNGQLEITLDHSQIDSPPPHEYAKVKPGNYIRLIVSDNGTGIKEEQFERIFDPYFTTKSTDEGSGIGLSVVHGIIESHEAYIFPKSVEDEGTSFTILFPALSETVPTANDIMIDQQTGKEHILFIDDEPSIVKLGERILKSLGYTVTSTTNPLEAIEWIERNPDFCDLVITDMSMPHMPGDNLVKSIAKINPDIPTIICTGNSSRLTESEASKIGVKGFLMKPMTKSELAATVGKVLT